jgi:hypothetical protein
VNGGVADQLGRGLLKRVATYRQYQAYYCERLSLVRRG